MRVLKLLHHPNIVSLLDSFKYKGRTCIVMEYVEQTILECLKVQPHGLDSLLTKQITWQLVKALEYMHNQKVPVFTPTSTASPAPPAERVAAHLCCLINARHALAAISVLS